MKTKLFLLLVLAFIVIGTVPSFAQIVISGGMVKNYTKNHGSVTNDVITVFNGNKKNKTRIKLYQTDYLTFANGQSKYDDPNTTPRSNASWIKVSTNEIDIDADGYVNVPFTVTIPNDKELAGTYYSAVMVEEISEPVLPKEKKDDEKAALTILTKTRYLIKVITTIGKTGEYKVEFSNPVLKAYYDEKESKNRYNFTVDVESVGNRVAFSNAYIDIFNEAGGKVRRFDIKDGFYLPDCGFRIRANAIDLDPGQYTFLVVNVPAPSEGWPATGFQVPISINASGTVDGSEVPAENSTAVPTE